MSEPACVKQEPGELGARGEPAEQLPDQVCVKEEPDLEPGEASVKTEALRELYADHVVKDELVLGPEGPHRPTGGLLVLECGVEVSEMRLPAVGARGSQRALRDCAVRLERLPLHALRLRTPAPDITPGHSQPNHLPVEDTCHICSMKFALQPDLKNHILTHIYMPEADTENEIYSNKLSNEGYLCDICDKLFALKVDLMEHVVVHIHVPGEEWGEDTEDKVSEKITVGGLERGGTLTPPPEPARAGRDTAPRHAADNTGAQRHSINNIADIQRHATNKNTDTLQRHAINNNMDKSQRYAANNDTDTRRHAHTNIYTCHWCSYSFRKKCHIICHIKHPPVSCEVLRNKLTFPYTCDICKSKFKSITTLRRHNVIHTDNPYCCDICKRTFSQKNYLERHIRWLHLRKTCFCKTCDKGFSSIISLNFHTRWRCHTERKPYSCEICKKIFTRSRTLIEHERIHREEKPYECKTCHKKFRQSSYLYRHERVHTGELACEICDKQFDRLYRLKAHLLVHAGEGTLGSLKKPYSCEICNIKTRTQSSLQSLKNNTGLHTGKKPDESYSCKSCEKKFKDKRSLHSHNVIHTGEMPYCCEICNKEFRDICTLRNHKRILHSHTVIHTGEIYQQKFPELQRLNKYTGLHTGEKSYSCKSCEKKFRNKKNLHSHIVIHTGEKPYGCEVCKTMFAHRSTLSIHRRIHTGEKPYRCEICNKKFRQKNILKKHHKRIHTGHKPCS